MTPGAAMYQVLECTNSREYVIICKINGTDPECSRDMVNPDAREGCMLYTPHV